MRALSLWAAVTASRLGQAASLMDIDHVVLFMQENRAFDHYFGSMAGVRGFNDANLQLNDNVPVWKQVTSPALTRDADHVSPWHLNYLGGDWPAATQCMGAGSNSWYENHLAWNLGRNDHWAVNNTPWSIGFYKRQDVPTHWALAEGWIVGDMYQESVVASTNPNRVSWISGSINAPGSPQRPDQGGNPYIDNNEVPGCEPGGFNCFPLKWTTAGELYEAAGVSWQVFQDEDNFDDNPYAWFEQFQHSKSTSSLYRRGFKGLSLNTFYDLAANGSLPEVSYIVGPMQLSEHPPYSPNDGAWLQTQIAQAVINSPKYNKTALIVSYDETGGWFDHVNPFHAPDGTRGEWIDDPWGQVGHTFTGPGFRVPFYIISPFTRNGGVYTGHADHSSQILFVEQWQAAKGRSVVTQEMPAWRRRNMGDLVDAFDFDHPDYSLPHLPVPPTPHKNALGQYDGSAHCQATHPHPRPPVPYTGPGAIQDMASVVEHGFKPVRGKLTEGRFLVLEADGFALANEAPQGLTLKPATAAHQDERQRWTVHAVQLGGVEFALQSYADKRFVCRDSTLCLDKQQAVVFQIDFCSGKGYSLKAKHLDGFLAVNNGGLWYQQTRAHWHVFSVSY
ncbi:hypothetical protein CDD82_2379 [Ophiocordyceps australis]|uniref:Phospholipase C n=1 Tax=Ophiocordyceps australis TaxID=1399860 RepID=A0A2C5ZI22_9HYPO|nr:hypothetical protein CDD82_2379 [Ophiocordyceps australis]